MATPREHRRLGRSWRRRVGSGLLGAGMLVSIGGAAVAAAADYHGFSAPRPVTIRGYRGDAMEPSITPDGNYLLFNNINQPGVHTTLRFARRDGSNTFVYGGEISGANVPGALSAVASLATDGTMYFISTRAYPKTFATIETGRFTAGRATHVRLIPRLATAGHGLVDFDVDVSADGTSLYVSQGQFGGIPAPSSARLLLYTRRRGGFSLDRRSRRLLRAVNRVGSLVYAACISRDGRELFFTRDDPGAPPAIYRAIRPDLHSPFAGVQRVAGARGFVEAPSLSSDGTVLYYHLRASGHYVISALTRPRARVP